MLTKRIGLLLFRTFEVEERCDKLFLSITEIDSSCQILTLSAILMMVSSKQVFPGEKYYFHDNTVLFRESLFPNFIRKAKLFNFASGKQVEVIGHSVSANGLADSPDAIMIFKTLPNGNAFNILNQSSRKFICFNRKAKVITRISGSSPRCSFIEAFSSDGLYSTFQSGYNNTWFVGFNSKGKALPGSKFRSAGCGKKFETKMCRCFHFTKNSINIYQDLSVSNMKLRHSGPKINPNKLFHFLKRLKKEY